MGTKLRHFLIQACASWRPLALIGVVAVHISWAMEVSAASFAYIANYDEGTVSVIDPASNQVVGAVIVRRGPYGVAVNAAGTQVYVRNSDDTVSVIDTATNTVVATVAVSPSESNAASLAVDPSGRFVYVASGYVASANGDNVDVIDAMTNTRVRTVPVGSYALGVAVDPRGGRVYVTNNRGNSISVIETGTNTVISTIPVGLNPIGVAVHPSGDRIYVANGGSNSVSVIDAVTLQEVTTIGGLNGAYGVAIHPAGTKVYVTNVEINTVSVINTATNTVDATVSVQSLPYGVAVDPTGEFVYVANSRSNTVSVIASATDTVVSTIPVGRRPTSLGQFIRPSVATVRTVADAGDDKTKDEGSPVTLDGSRSQGMNLTYSWRQVAGPPVELSGATSPQPTFVAPILPGGFGSQTLTFELTVTSGNQSSSTDTVNVTVVNVNHFPIALTGGNQTVREGSVVVLSGESSYDPDGDPLRCEWEQILGPPVILNGADTCIASFTAPLLPGGVSGSATLTFRLTVSDTVLSSADEIQVMVEQVNHPPTANAGPDQTKNEGSVVSLNGIGSNDPDADPLTYTWSQVSGPPVTLFNPSSATPTFTAPVVGPGGATLVFRLVVGDGLATSEPDEAIVTVQNVNDPPRCELAQPSRPALWPPNHKLLSVGIVGLADPDNDRIAITIAAVTQDEPVNGLGDGDTSPDAVIQGDQVLLRAERSGTGNGRVYQVQFRADDNQILGGACTGAVAVEVRHSMKPGNFALDDGQLYDSTQP